MKKLLVSIQPESKFDQAATFIDRFAAGGIAGFSSHLFTYPIKVVQTRMANQRPFGSEFNGIIDAFRKIRCETGYLGFYRGFLVSVAGIGPAMGLDFAVSQKLHNEISKKCKIKKRNTLILNTRWKIIAKTKTGQTMANTNCRYKKIKKQKNLFPEK